MNRIQGIEIPKTLVEDACGSGDTDAANRSVEALKFAGEAVFADAQAICEAMLRHPRR